MYFLLLYFYLSLNCSKLYRIESSLETLKNNTTTRILKSFVIFNVKIQVFDSLILIVNSQFSPFRWELRLKMITIRTFLLRNSQFAHD